MEFIIKYAEPKSDEQRKLERREAAKINNQRQKEKRKAAQEAAKAEYSPIFIKGIKMKILEVLNTNKTMTSKGISTAIKIPVKSLIQPLILCRQQSLVHGTQKFGKRAFTYQITSKGKELLEAH